MTRGRRARAHPRASHGRPVFGDVMAFLQARGFALFDVASLGGRPRDQRLRVGDAIFIRRRSPLGQDVWSD